MEQDTIFIKIEIENEAFKCPDYKPELSRILKDLADRLRVEGLEFPRLIKDINGNTVGNAFLLTKRIKV